MDATELARKAAELDQALERKRQALTAANPGQRVWVELQIGALQDRVAQLRRQLDARQAGTA